MPGFEPQPKGLASSGKQPQKPSLVLSETLRDLGLVFGLPQLLVRSNPGYTLFSTREKTMCNHASNFQSKSTLARWRACPTEKHETNITTRCKARVSQFWEAFQLSRIRFRYCFDFPVREHGSSPPSALS